MKSKIAPKKIKIPDKIISPWKIKIIENRPHKRFVSVIMFGIFLFYG